MIAIVVLNYSLDKVTMLNNQSQSRVKGLGRVRVSYVKNRIFYWVRVRIDTYCNILYSSDKIFSVKIFLLLNKKIIQRNEILHFLFSTQFRRNENFIIFC